MHTRKLFGWLIIVILFFVMLPVSTFATVEATSLAANVSVNGTSADTTAAWPIQHGEYFAIQIKAAGSADLKVQYQLSYDGINWGYEAGTLATDPLISNLTSTSWELYTISPMVNLFMRFITTGNAGNGASGVSYSLVALQWKK